MKFRLLLLILITSTQLYSQQLTFASQRITPEIFRRMKHTWRDDSPVPISDLRYLRVSHFDFQGRLQTGELVVHVLAANDLLFIFEKLLRIKFPIASMKLIDDFGSSDDASMSANNTSAFYARMVAGTDRWSNHSYGLAIDINPLINPYTKDDICCPQEGTKYVTDRSPNVAGIITPQNLIYKLFKMRGWQWGGECFYKKDGTIDRHHFQKVVPGINARTN